MGQISYTLPTIGQPDSTEDPKVLTALSTLQSSLNSGLVGGLQIRTTTAAATAADGQMIVVTTGNGYITLPAPSAVGRVGVIAPYAATAGPVLVVAGSGSIVGQGVNIAATTGVTVGAAGAVFWSDGTNYYMLGQQDSGWTALTLNANWNATAGVFAPQARLIGDRVWLRGGVTNATGGASSAIGSVPSSMHPTSGVNFAVAAGTSATGLNITTAGVVSTLTSVTNTTPVYLDGCSYSLS